MVELHGTYYANEWGFGPQFEAEVASELAEFIGRYDDSRDGFWLAWQGERIMASLTLDHALADGESTPRVRWFVADPAMQGTGVGRLMFDALLSFAGETRQQAMHLWTFEGLLAARKLYDLAGFVVTHEVDETDWGPTINAQRMERATP